MGLFDRSCDVVACLPIACVAACALAPMTQAQAQEGAYVSWAEQGPGNWASNTLGIEASMTLNALNGEPLSLGEINADNPEFVAIYGEVIPVFNLENPSSGHKAEATASLQFDAPLPAGSQLLVFDVDISDRGEKARVYSPTRTVDMVNQMETHEGAVSDFPTWNDRSLLLSATTLFPNAEEASIFDVSGGESLDLTYFRDTGGTGITGANFAVYVVPEPASMLACAGMLGLAFKRRRR